MAMNTLGALIRPKPPPMVKKVEPHVIDVPGTGVGDCGHIPRLPGSDYKVRLMQYEQRKKEYTACKNAGSVGGMGLDNLRTDFFRHCEKNFLHREIVDRVNKKVKAEMETNVATRREKLRKLLLAEQEAYFKETVDIAQHGNDSKMADMRAQIAKLQKDREDARLKLLAEKRLQQDIQRCDHLRPLKAQKNLLESKRCQLLQIQENESRRAAERELEHMWYQVMQKEMDAKKEREEQDALDQKHREMLGAEILARQVRAKEMLREEELRVGEEDRIELEKLKEQIREEKRQEAEAKEALKIRLNNELMEQVESNRQLQEKRAKEEATITEAYAQLTRDAIAKEKAAVSDTATALRLETKMYREYIETVNESRRQEEAEFERMVEEDRQKEFARQNRQREEFCQYQKKLQRETFASIESQKILKAAKAEEERKEKEAENELVRLTLKQNQEMDKVHEAYLAERRRRHAADLQKQIAYNQLRKQREVEEEARQLASAVPEEAQYVEIARKLMADEISDGRPHPFTPLLTQVHCHCPEDAKK